VVPGPKTKRTCPAHDEPNDSDPPPTGTPSAGCAPAEFWIPWAELLRRTGVWIQEFAHVAQE